MQILELNIVKYDEGKFNFLDKIFGDEYNEKELLFIIDYFKYEELSFKTLLGSQGQKAEKVYIIKKGTI